jgi:hypothetical protein
MLTEEQATRFEQLRTKVKEVKYLRLSKDERAEYQSLKALEAQNEEPVVEVQTVTPDRTNRDNLLDAFNELKDADARSGLGQVLQVPGIDQMSVTELMKIVFEKVHDGDARAVVHKHFNI